MKTILATSALLMTTLVFTPTAQGHHGPPCPSVPPGGQVIVEEELVVESGVPCRRPVQVARGATLRPDRAEWFWGVGLTLGTIFRAHSELFYGGAFKVLWEPTSTDRLRLETDLALMGRSGDGLILDWTLGAGWVIADWVVAPVVSGGIGMQYVDLQVKRPEDGHQETAQDLGFTAYVALSLEALRRGSTRLVIDARFDIPAYRTGPTGTDGRWVPAFRSTVSFLW